MKKVVSKFQKNKRNIIRYSCSLGILFIILFCEAFYIKSNQSMGEMTTMPTANAGSQLIADVEYIQEFVCTESKMEAIILQMTRNTDLNSVDLEIELRIDDEMVQTWILNKYSLTNTYCKLTLNEPQTGMEGEKCQLIFRGNGNTGVLVYMSNQMGAGASKLLSNNGEEREDVSFCYSIVKNNIKTSMVFVGVALFTIIAYGILCWWLFCKKNVKTELVFAYCYIVMGIFQMAAVPIFKVPDEEMHFRRAYEVSMGEFITNEVTIDGENETTTLVGNDFPQGFTFGDYLGKVILNIDIYDLKELYQYELDKTETQFLELPTAALYAPGTYLPQAIGIKIAELFTNRALLVAYGARIANWLFTGILLFLSIRYLPVGKNIAFLVSMIPMLMQQYSSISPDGFTMAICMAMISFSLYHRFSHEKIMSVKDYVVMYLLIIILCQCKIIYAPMCALLFLIPIEKFGGIKKYITHVTGAIVVAGIVCITWLGISSRFFMEYQPGVSSAQQVIYILSNPIEYLMVLLRSFDASGDFWIRSGLGEYLGWINIPTSFTLLMIYLCVVVVYVFLDNDIKKVDFKLRDRLILGITSVGIILLVFTSLYMQWTAYHATTIAGVQGRYFLPIMLSAILAIKPSKTQVANTGLNGNFAYLIVLGINMCISTILLTYAI